MRAACSGLGLRAGDWRVEGRAGNARLSLVVSGQVTQIDADISNRLIPVGGILRQALANDSLKLGWRSGIDFPYQWSLCVNDLMQRVYYGFAGERIGAGRGFIKNAPE